MQDVVIVAFDGVQSLDVTGPLEVFAGANVGVPGTYRITVGSVGKRPVTTSGGLRILPDADLDDVPGADLIVVPGGTGTRHGQDDVAAWLRDRAPAARRIMAVCTGAFILGDAGLLDGRQATTHWDHCAALARRHTSTRVDPDPIFVRDGNIATSAGVTAGIDLALALVEEDLGRHTALQIARQLVMFLRRPGGQRQFSVQLRAQLAEHDNIREVQQYIVERPDTDLSIKALAERASLSERQFSRTFTKEVGVSPGRYVDQARLEAARRRLEDTRDGIEQVARACGYGTPEAMRRAFVKELGVAPLDYRERFRCAL
ncbi:GlxA family transcriptional regulator [Dactylosporangium sp. AC04546]|uniref:GlxA family transcriptional regulator n=1 Tax=Dactylosporangium sp. AC04546 TaxID=2862460 RepID=UPI001EE0CAA7|nr:GlxA family transcriptional regulator [Dactylosporangium sp. AC04546]WVK80221.1 GlxA family transcriptional regulator [Dactylosporangium sp. AC04546]